MLTADLIRVRTRKGSVSPLYLDEDDPTCRERAEELVQIFRAHRARTKGEIDAALEDAIGHGTDFLIWRGLAKLLLDRSTLEVVSAVDPVELRRTIFELAATHAPIDEETRTKVLAEAAQKLEISPKECEEGLYADLEERQILTEFDDLEPLDLIRRYNVALAQAVLYRATRLDIDLYDRNPNKLRYLFQALKFHRLMHLVRRTDEGFRFVVDGPASLFKKSRKYGLNMAMFLPALLLAKDYKLTAELDWKGDGKAWSFELTPDDGLVSHYRARGQWKADEEKWFEQRFADYDTDWNLAREGVVLDLDDGEVLVPDYVLTSPAGEEVYVEVVGFWRKGYLERRIDRLDRLDKPLVLVVSERLNTDRKKLDDAPAAVVFFKGVILVDRVMDAAHALLDAR